MKRTYHAFIRCIALLENIFCYTGLLLSSFMVFAQVLNRYFLHYEIMWIGDLTLFIFVPMMILSIALTTRHGGHTSVDVFMDMAFDGRPMARKIYDIVLEVMVLSVIVYLLPMAFKLFRHALKFSEYSTLVRWFNTSWIRETVLIMIALCAIHTLHRIGLKVLDLRAGMPAADNGGAS